MNYKGGVKGVKISIDEALTAPVSVAFNQIVKEGNQFPDPEPMTDGLASEQDAQSGIKIPFALRLKDVAQADVDTLRGHAESNTPVFVEFESMTGEKEMLKHVTITCVARGTADLGKFKSVKIAGAAAGPTDAYCRSITVPGA